MSPLSTSPVVIGVGDIINRSVKVEDAREPAQLMLEAIQYAIGDTGLSSSKSNQLQSSIDSIDVINTWTWPYHDLPGLISQKLRVEPKHKYTSPHGGNQPGKLLDEAARRISQGKTKVAVLTGGEALASLTACVRVKKMPPPGWTTPSQSVDSIFSPTSRPLADNLGAVHSIGAPIQAYPLFENGYRAHRGQSIQQNNMESAELYADFAKIAVKNPFAWNYGKMETAESIGTVSQRNRMICFPYPLLMNAFNTVNLAAAIILTSAQYARELGVPKSKWIYPLGGAGTQDSSEFWERPNFHSSPSISRSLDAGMKISGLKKEDIDLFDFYSCFPIVPKLAALHLGLPLTDPTKPISLLGGLTSFGGAGNNYSMHAITALTRALRTGKHQNGLVLANGGVATYQHVICLSSHPRRDGSAYPGKNPLPEFVTDIFVPEVDVKVQGKRDGVVETYTVEFNRDGTPLRGYVVGRLGGNGHRFLANHGDETTLKRMASGEEEIIGLNGVVWNEKDGKGRNLFRLEEQERRSGAKL